MKHAVGISILCVLFVAVVAVIIWGIYENNRLNARCQRACQERRIDDCVPLSGSMYANCATADGGLGLRKVEP
jgi:hypothetical protein